MNFSLDEHIKKRQVLNILLMVIYSLVYDYIVKNFLYEVFGYLLDYNYTTMTSSQLFMYIVVAVIPIIFYKGFTQLASVFSFFCYLFVYIPFVHVSYVANYPIDKISPYLLVLLFLQCTFFITDTYTLGVNLSFSKKKISFRTFEIICLILLAIVVLMNIGKMHFVNILSGGQKEMLYELRSANQDGSTFNAYICRWLNHALLPILMICYLQNKHYIKLAIAFLGMIAIFMIDMQKISFIVPFLIVGFYFFYNAHKLFFLQNFSVIVLIALIIIPLSVIKNINNPLSFTIASILIMRTQCVEGSEFARYFDFFEMNDNPYTYYTHINFINKITGLYPYHQSIGYTVSYGESNSNANFFLMDGMAAMGFVGFIIAGILFIIFKSFFNTIGIYYDKGLCMIVMLFSISALMNVSLFTALLTGGFLVIYLVYKYVDLTILEKNETLCNL